MKTSFSMFGSEYVNIVFKSSLMYGSKSWIWRTQNRKQSEAAHVRFLTPVYVVTLKD
jgi:hypothetical protein